MKHIKDLTIGFIVGGILFGIIGVSAANQLEAIGVTYNNDATSATNVDEALDELITKANEAKGGKTLVGTYSGNQTLSLSTLGYSGATADDFLVVITKCGAGTAGYATLSVDAPLAYGNYGGSNPTWSVSGDSLNVTGMTATVSVYDYFGGNKKTAGTTNTWQLYYVG